jgi:hypothetical protein
MYGLPRRSPEQWLAALLLLEVGMAVRIKIGEIGSTESVGCGAKQISSPSSKKTIFFRVKISIYWRVDKDSE